MSEALEKARELVEMLEEIEEKKTNKVILSSLFPGDFFKVGKYDFIVLEQLCGKTKVISKELMEENVIFDDDIRDYKRSSVKKLIEKDIQPIIEKEIGTENLIEHEVDLTSVGMQNEFGSLKCKVRLITFDEARKYNDLISGNNKMKDWWWTCTPWSTKERGLEYSIAVVAPSGFFCNVRCYFVCGVRPVCILKSNIFVSKGE